MANTTNRTTNKTTESKDSKKIAELEAQIKVLTELIKNSNVQSNTNEDYKEISPNRKTKVTSLTYGLLALYAPNRTHLRFEHFGQTLTLTYAQLCDYVNNCRSTAEAGAFYIHNEEMVEELELAPFPRIVENIINGELVNYQEILGGLNNSQKETLGAVFADKIYKGEFADLNKIDQITRALDIDLLKKVEEMRSVEEIVKTN